MDEQTSYDHAEPYWDLILLSLEGTLSPEQDLELKTWLEASPVNKEMYDRVVHIYENDLEDYTLYATADENKAWAALTRKMAPKKVFTLKHWLAAAAIVFLVVGAGWWYLAGSGRNNIISYATTAGEQKTISLSDGTNVLLAPHSHIELAHGYNTNNRTIVLIDGKAQFDVSHQKNQPFEVDMDAARVKDIGTSFVIDKTADNITVSVNTGRIAFISKKDGKTTEVEAGGSICLYTGNLRFENVPLTQILAGLEKSSGKQILLADSAAAQKRLTVNLDGESFENALEVICSSANLKHTFKDGKYILEKMDTKE